MLFDSLRSLFPRRVFPALLLFTLLAGAAQAASTGIDTLAGATTLPISVQGTSVLTLTNNAGNIFGSMAGPLGIGVSVPTATLDVNGTLRVRSATGASILQLDAASNGPLAYLENQNGSFAVLNEGNQHIFSVDQNGSGQINVLTAYSLVVPSNWGSADQVHIDGNQVWNSAGSLYFNYNTPGNSVIIGGNGYQALNVPNGTICLNGSCINTWPSSGSGPQGPQGPQGGQGVQGPPGNPGPQGAPGSFSGQGFYSCPDTGPYFPGGGDWGTQGCVGQVSQNSTCTNYVHRSGAMIPVYTAGCNPL